MKTANDMTRTDRPAAIVDRMPFETVSDAMDRLLVLKFTGADFDSRFDAILTRAGWSEVDYWAVVPAIFADVAPIRVTIDV